MEGDRHRVDIAESTAIYHANRVAARPLPRFRPVVATLTPAGLRVSELCALNCEHVDLARRELRVLDAAIGVRRVDIHDDLQEELAAAWPRARRDAAAGKPAFRTRAASAGRATRSRST